MLYSFLAKKSVYRGGNKILGCVKDFNIEYATGKILELIAGSFLKLKRENIAIDDIKIEEDRILYVSENSGANSFRQVKADETGSIINKKVYTESGIFLGKVKDFQIDLQFWRLSDIRVKSLSSSKELIIGEDQIVSMDKERIIVKDAIIENVAVSAA